MSLKKKTNGFTTSCSPRRSAWTLFEVIRRVGVFFFLAYQRLRCLRFFRPGCHIRSCPVWRDPTLSSYWWMLGVNRSIAQALRFHSSVSLVTVALHRSSCCPFLKIANLESPSVLLRCTMDVWESSWFPETFPKRFFFLSAGIKITVRSQGRSLKVNQPLEVIGVIFAPVINKLAQAMMGRFGC